MVVSNEGLKGSPPRYGREGTEAGEAAPRHTSGQPHPSGWSWSCVPVGRRQLEPEALGEPVHVVVVVGVRLVAEVMADLQLGSQAAHPASGDGADAAEALGRVLPPASVGQLLPAVARLVEDDGVDVDAPVVRVAQGKPGRQAGLDVGGVLEAERAERVLRGRAIGRGRSPDRGRRGPASAPRAARRRPSLRRPTPRCRGRRGGRGSPSPRRL